MKKLSWIIIPLFYFTYVQELRAQCPELKLQESMASQDEPVFRVDSIEGNALYSLIESSDMGRANDICIGLYDEKDRYLITWMKNGLKGEFAFYEKVPGTYRIVAVSKAMIPLSIIVELKEKPDTKLENQQRLLLHMRLKNSRGRKSYASLISVKEYKEREKP